MKDTEFRDLFSKVANTVSIVCVSDEKGNVFGSTISSLGSASVEKESQKILIVLRKDSRTGRVIKNQNKFSINILRDNQVDLAKQFSNKFTQLDIKKHLKYEKNIPLLNQSLFSIACTFEKSFEIDGNEIIIGSVDISYHVNTGSKPLIYANREYS
jgi:flavin reductase (DIM6/NTAB) family NADH-FMN oxidoreductase RutF